MLKLLILIFGVLVGGAGVGGWLLSEPDAEGPPPVTADPNSIRGRLETARIRFEEAWAQGRVAGRDTQVQLQQKLDAYRAGK